MARIVGAISTSHVPLIGKAIARRLQHDPYFKPFFDGFAPVHEWLRRVEPDVAVIIYNDHGLNFFLDKMPTFAIGAALQYQNADEGWGLAPFPPFPGDPALSWHLIESLVTEEFDLTTCQEMLVDHAFTLPMALLWPQAPPWPVRTVPVCINTVQHPLPSPARCYKLGQAIARAVESYPGDARIVILGTGGLSHQLDGTRAGFINTDFDRYCLRTLVDDPRALLEYSPEQIIELAGSQGVELLNWIAARGAISERARELQNSYHVPISNTASAVLLLEQAA
jgi:protocatechuate 4,5-dioxygenase beta chain